MGASSVRDQCMGMVLSSVHLSGNLAACGFEPETFRTQVHYFHHQATTAPVKKMYLFFMIFLMLMSVIAIASQSDLIYVHRMFIILILMFIIISYLIEGPRPGHQVDRRSHEQ